MFTLILVKNHDFLYHSFIKDYNFTLISQKGNDI